MLAQNALSGPLHVAAQTNILSRTVEKLAAPTYGNDLLEVAVYSRRPLTPTAALPDVPTLPLFSVTGVFEASLTPQGANQFDCELDAFERIEAAIRIDHVATCGWPIRQHVPALLPAILAH